MKLPAPLHVINEGLAFLLEVTALVVLACWGWQSVENMAVRLVLAVAAPLSAAVLWGLFASPKARIPVPLTVVLGVKVLVFGAAVAALYAIGRHGWATVFAIVIAVNTALATLDRNALMHQEA
ncbi:YrdB family protein [Streptomyces sp. NPDC001076]